MPSHVALILLATALALPAAGQDPASNKVAAHYTSPASGSETYMAYCASCHGTKGLGNGAVSENLKIVVPDLTILSQQNKGVFPAAHVTQVIRGQVGVKTHGLQDMPVWGPVFLNLNNRQEAAVHIRVSNLTKYIESLQVK
jgi:mono/diheme cytochrome c family protein